MGNPGWYFGTEKGYWVKSKESKWSVCLVRVRIKNVSISVNLVTNITHIHEVLITGETPDGTCTTFSNFSVNQKLF